MTPTGIIIGLVVGLIIGGAGVFFTNKPKHEEKLRQIEQEIAARREANEREIDKILQQANRDADKTRNDAERALKDANRNAERRSTDLKASEDRLEKTQQNLDRQRSKIENREQALGKRQGNMDRRQNELEKVEERRREELEKVSSLTSEEAKEQLLAAVEAESRKDMARIMREIEDKAKENGEERARSLIAQAIQRVASDYVAETTISIVPLANDEMKGRIIGRAGRNIRAFELAAGVDVIVDDTPEAVTVSSFDSVRREIARIALSKLVVDGRIHPARIEKTISDAKKEVNKAIREAGEQAAYEANVSGLHPEIIKMMGRLKYRTSYGQNQLEHSIEASKIAAILAAEMGANVNMAKMGGFLHDIGKAMDHDQEGTHAALGAEFIKRFKVPKNVVNAVASHHHEVDQESVEAILVEAADAISGARPGARRESLENYIKRVRTLEEIATSFDGVESAYALQAGREIRILVKPDAIDDLDAMRLSKEVAKSIEDSMQYPGTIQVTVIRETRSVDHAK